jgi:hypothetical protein
MSRHLDVINTSMKLWSERNVEGAVVCRSHYEPHVDATAVMLTTQNYSKKLISGMVLARCDGTQELMRLVEHSLRGQVLELASQLEKVASQIRAAA